MTDRVCLPLALALALSAAPAPAQDRNVGASVPWCQIDHPAAWRAAREEMIADGIRELDNVPCPPLAPAQDVPQELALPLPCGRAMIFSRVDVPVSHMLDQVPGNFGRVVDIASETPQTVLSNGPWSAPVAGAFTLSDAAPDGATEATAAPAARAYYLASYELTQPQWALFALGLFDADPEAVATADAPACAAFDAELAATDLRRIPARGGLSWYDAVSYSRALSAWLIRRDALSIALGRPPALPWEQGATGFVRLPTEAEWEFAARGGASAVSQQGRSIRLPQIRDGDGVRTAQLDEVCAEAPRGGELLAPVGTRLPNALGLYDVICNAEEIVLDLFRPTRPDGLGGQTGGVVTKGGSSVLLREQNTVGRRSEGAALFDADGEGATATMGTRLAISAPVFVGRRDAGQGFVTGIANQPMELALMAGRERLLEAGVGLASGSAEELASEVNRLRRAAAEGALTQEELAQRADSLQAELDRLTAALSAERDDAARRAIRSGVVTGNLIDRIGRNVFLAMQRVQILSQDPDITAEQRADLAALQGAIALNERRIQTAFDLYLQVHTDLAVSETAFVFTQIRETRRGLSGASIEVFGSNLELLDRHQRDIRETRGQVSEQIRLDWLDQLDSTRARRRQQFPEQQR